MRKHRCAGNVTLANLWIKCLQCGNILILTEKAVQQCYVTSAIQPFREGVTKEPHLKAIKLIGLDNQLMSVVEDQGFGHLEFLSMLYHLGIK